MSGAEILLEPGVFPRLLQGLWVTVWIAGVRWVFPFLWDWSSAG